MLTHKFARVLLSAMIVFASWIVLAQEPLPPVTTPEVNPDPNSSESTVIEFYGIVQAVSRSALLINGQIIDTQAATVPLIVVGDGVRVQAEILPDGTIAAVQVDYVPPQGLPGIIMINGRISAFSSENESIILGNISLQVNNAMINGSLSVGTSVRAFVTFNGGQWSALAVVVATPAVIVQTPSPQVLPPVSTPDVIFDDNSGHGGGNDDSDDDD